MTFTIRIMAKTNLLMKHLGSMLLWGMKKMMSMTVDNAKSNKVAIKYIVKKLPSIYDNGNQFHIRCMAHIINLIMKMGLKHQNYHIECVQNAVKYIRGSTQRINKFKKAMKDVAVDTKRFLCAYDVRDAFVEFRMQEKSFEKDVDRVPELKDFEEIKKTIDFLEKFKTKTKKVSCSTKPLFHQFTREILDIELHLTTWSTDPSFAEMVPGMKENYDRYWGDYKKMSDFISSVQVPIFVIHFYRTDSVHQEARYDYFREKWFVKPRGRWRAFKTYLENYDTGLSSQQQIPQQVFDCDDDNDFFGNYLNSRGVNSRMVETEPESYLNEPPINYNKNFDILSWWKLNGLQYPIVAQMAKDILGIQISTVASESTFSTGRRVITDYRFNFSVGIGEALICTADWTWKSRTPIMDNVDNILNDDDVAIELEEAIHSSKAMGKRPMMNYTKLCWGLLKCTGDYDTSNVSMDTSLKFSDFLFVCSDVYESVAIMGFLMFGESTSVTNNTQQVNMHDNEVVSKIPLWIVVISKHHEFKPSKFQVPTANYSLIRFQLQKNRLKPALALTGGSVFRSMHVHFSVPILHPVRDGMGLLLTPMENL
ncbi:hypothetical protein LXL04_033489 [Taraxacum kok-saghyz]